MGKIRISRGMCWLGILLAVATVQACGFFQRTPPVTQIVEVTRLQEVTRLVPVTVFVEVTPTGFTAGPVPVPTGWSTPVEFPSPVPPPAATGVPAGAVTQLEPSPAIPVPAPTEAQPTPRPPLRNQALLVWYDFEGDFLGSGVVRDRSGNGFDGRVTGDVGVARGITRGQAATFSGDGYILAASNPAAGRDALTFSLWFKTDEPENNYKLASGAWWNGGVGSGWVLATHIPELWSNNLVSLFPQGTSNNDNYFPSGEWVQEVVTYDGVRIREYTDGQMVNDWIANGEAVGQGESMAVGGWPLQPAYNFVGSIDEFKIFAWAMTWQEVQDLYDQER